MMYVLIENWFKTPKDFIEAYPLLETVGEMKLALYTVRHLWSENHAHHITFEELLHGKLSPSGNRLDSGTQLPDQELRLAIAALIEKRFLREFAGDIYALPYAPTEPESPVSPAVIASKPNNRGYVYLLKSDVLYKIGRSVNPTARIKGIMTGSPSPIATICVIETNNMVKLEAELHARFASKRRQGEWFALTDDDVEFIRTMLEVSQGDAS